MHLHKSDPKTRGHHSGIFRSLRGSLSGPIFTKFAGHASGRVRRRGLRPTLVLIRTAAASTLVLCLLGGLGCSSDKRAVEDVAFQWVDGIKNGKAETFERIIDWERWYSVASGGSGSGTESPEGQGQGHQGRPTTPPARSGQAGDLSPEQEYQKSLLLTLLSADQVLAMKYRTADHKIKRVSIKGPEAVAEVSQDDRTSGERRLITLFMHKAPDVGWRVYKFSMEDLEEV